MSETRGCTDGVSARAEALPPLPGCLGSAPGPACHELGPHQPCTRLPGRELAGESCPEHVEAQIRAARSSSAASVLHGWKTRGCCFQRSSELVRGCTVLTSGVCTEFISGVCTVLVSGPWLHCPHFRSVSALQ